MSNRYMSGLMLGGLMGIAAGMLLMPQVDRQTKRRLLDRGMNMVENASHMVPGMGRMMKR